MDEVMKAQFTEAKALIQQGRYQDARKVLRRIQHPTARAWEAKLPPSREGMTPRKWLILLGLALVLVALGAIITSTIPDTTAGIREIVDRPRSYYETRVVGTMTGESRQATETQQTLESRQATETQQSKPPTATFIPFPPSNSFVCPASCEEVQSMGLSAEAAARCGLDEDGDGVACYGD